jgi:hypothetical protein
MGSLKKVKVVTHARVTSLYAVAIVLLPPSSLFARISVLLFPVLPLEVLAQQCMEAKRVLGVLAVAV